MKNGISNTIRSGIILLLSDLLAWCALCAICAALVMAQILPQEGIKSAQGIAPIAAALIAAFLVMRMTSEKKLPILGLGQGLFMIVQAIICISAGETELLPGVLIGVVCASGLALVLSNVKKRGTGHKHFDKMLSKSVR